MVTKARIGSLPLSARLARSGAGKRPGIDAVIDEVERGLGCEVAQSGRRSWPSR